MVIFHPNGLKLVVSGASFKPTINLYTKWTTSLFALQAQFPVLQLTICGHKPVKMQLATCCSPSTMFSEECV